MIYVSWDDAQKYIAWLNRKTGEEFRLPSEAEWEYAARAGTKTKYWWGDEVGKNNANCNGCGSQWDGKQTAPVASFRANPFGLYDMDGNVRQWVEDYYADSYQNAPADGSAALGSSSFDRRVLRGASWDDPPDFLRSANRASFPPLRPEPQRVPCCQDTAVGHPPETAHDKKVRTVTQTALEGICETVDPAEFDFSWWFDPFGLEPADIVRDILPKAADKAWTVTGCAANRTYKPFPLPPGEPEGELLTWPGARCGLAMLVAERDGQPMLTALWPFTTDGVEHEIRIDKVSLAPDRLQAVIEGTIGDTLSLAWLDVQFAADRAYYAAGSVHQVVLAGIAHQFDVGAPPPVRIAPDAPNYEFLRQDLSPEALDDDGAITVRTDGMAAIFPLDDAPMTLHSIQGPVKRIDEYGGEMFGRKVWRLRVTVARIGDDYDTDVDLDVFLTDVVLDGRPLPAVGGDVSATVHLQGRIWQPNLQRFR